MEKMLFAVFFWICTGLALSLEDFPKWGTQNDNKFGEILSRVSNELFKKELAKSAGILGEPRSNTDDLILLLGTMVEQKPMTFCRILWNTGDDDSLDECVAFLMQIRNQMLVNKEQKRQGTYRFNSSGWKRKKRDTSNKLSREEIMKIIQQILKVKKRRKFQASGW
ncbi:uncharacterized protein LOC133181315 [Saccostrea echinata]|uniref:uncharacterized protein LOC133181315 n=1 Tax=Saccostrea echinata TaxID=191078 RepID=UPI002A825F27|nr:uncharacterized protein LOC133181315 [Saccostrea echinata]